MDVQVPRGTVPAKAPYHDAGAQAWRQFTPNGTSARSRTLAERTQDSADNACGIRQNYTEIPPSMLRIRPLPEHSHAGERQSNRREEMTDCGEIGRSIRPYYAISHQNGLVLRHFRARRI